MHRERRHLIDRPPGHAHVARFAPQTRAAAFRAGEVSPIPAEEHTDVHLVLLALEPTKESADTFVVVIRTLRAALDDELLFSRRELGPRHVEPEPVLPRSPLQLCELRAIVR